MRLWSIQTENAVRRIKEKGELRGDWRRVDHWFKEAYQWLCVEMEKADIGLKGRPPVWAWTRRPDLRYSAHGQKGETLYLLELDVPDDEILVSNFGAWHCVLNPCFVTMNDAEFHKMWDDDSPYSDQEIEESWQRIFDLELVAGPDNYGDDCQATFPVIDQSYIRKMRRFIAR